MFKIRKNTLKIRRKCVKKIKKNTLKIRGNYGEGTLKKWKNTEKYFGNRGKRKLYVENT